MIQSFKNPVTVLLSSFNHAPYIREAIDSVLNQTFSDFNFVIWDDASTDESWDIIQSYRDDRITTYREEKNTSGYGYSQHLAQIKHSEFVALHHSDDVWHENKLARQIELMREKPEIGAVFTHAEVFNHLGSPLPANDFYKDIFNQANRSRVDWLRRFFYEGNCLCNPSALIRSSILPECGGFGGSSFYQLDDFDRWVRIALRYPLWIITEPLVRFRRIGNQNVSSDSRATRLRSSFEFTRILEKYLALPEPSDVFSIFPEVQVFRKADEYNLDFLVAMAALQGEPSQQHMLFAVNTLSDLIERPDGEAELERLHGFTFSDFRKLLGKYDPLAIEVVRDQRDQMKAMEAKAQAMEAKAQAMEAKARAAEDQSQHAMRAAREVTDALRLARKRPHVILGHLLKFRVMRTLSSKSSPLPSRMKNRFARSAGKVDPRRAVLADQLLHDRRSLLPTVTQAMTGMLECEATNASPEDLKRAFRAGAERQLDAFLASQERITLPRTDEPKVSIILVLWNQAGLTLKCLRSLEMETTIPFEVIVVDNGSTDRTAELLAKVENIVLLPQTENLGYLQGVNRGLEAVRGGHVLLLNNDATLRPGSLSAAVEAMASGSDIGAVGGPIILPDGRLQEAGSIIWQDGSCLGYGRGDDPAAGPYNFRREVDYCSGAFLLIREGLFQQLGGFDTDFIPAYYEETDLCMRIRSAGKKVVFEPLAAVDHFEFASSEKLENVLEMQRANQRKFVKKHSEQLRNGHMPPATSNVLFARERQHRERILYIDDRVPMIAQGAGFPRANEIVHLMVEDGYFVTYFPSTTPVDDWEDARSAVPAGVEIAMGWGLPLLERFLEERRGYYQQIFVSRPHNMRALAVVRKNRPELFEKIRLTYDAEALFASRDAVKAELFGDKRLLKKAAQERLSELALVHSADQVTAVSQAEADQFSAASGKPARVLGHAVVPMPTQAKFAEREEILFLGRLAEDGSPNVDSLIWYANCVQPLLDTLSVGPRPLTIAGLSTAPSIHELDPARFRLLGVVDGLQPIFDRARVFVAPTRFAAGIPHKVHQAAALGVPVVTTSLLARQLGWEDGRDLLVADTPETFASAVHRLYSDQDLWESIRTNALQRITTDCSVVRFREALRETLGGAVSNGLRIAPSIPAKGSHHQTAGLM